MGERRLTRREALRAASASAVGAWLLAGCGADAGTLGALPGSTLELRLGDPGRNGILRAIPGLPLIDRTDLAAARSRGTVLATLAQLSDLHVHDAQSPARVPFLDRLGPRFGSAFRPHETLVPAVLAGALGAINRAGPDAVIVSGDLLDSAQQNELDWALALLSGATVRPDSGGAGYEGVQSPSNPDPAYYRPGVDPPRHAGLLRRALGPVRVPRLRAPWYPVLGNHDVLVQGAVGPSDATRATATGERLVVSPDAALLALGRSGRLSRGAIDGLLRRGLPGRAISVTPDRARAHLDAAGAVRRMRAAGAASQHAGGDNARLDHAFEVGERLLVIVLDVVRRDQGAGGLVTAATVSFLRDALDAAGERWVIVCTHQPLAGAENAVAALALLDRDPRVVAVLAGHTHRNDVTPRRSATGGYWLITTCSLIDWPQQWRMLRLIETAGGGIALEAWMVDHPGRPNDPADLAGIARDLAYLDVQGGRPAGAGGPRNAQNVRLHLPSRRPRAPTGPTGPAAAPAPSPAPAPAGAGLGDTLTP